MNEHTTTNAAKATDATDATSATDLGLHDIEVGMDLTDALGPAAAGANWKLLSAGADLWHLHRDGAPVGTVQYCPTSTGREAWRARLADGANLRAGTGLAAADSNLWSSRNLAIAGLVHHLTRPTNPTGA